MLAMGLERVAFLTQLHAWADRAVEPRIRENAVVADRAFESSLEIGAARASGLGLFAFFLSFLFYMLLHACVLLESSDSPWAPFGATERAGYILFGTVLVLGPDQDTVDMQVMPAACFAVG